VDNFDSFRSNVLTAGHRTCTGCGEAIATRMVTDLIGENAIYVNAMGSQQSLDYQNQTSAWKAPCIHSLFSNSAAIASGVETALRQQGSDVAVVVQVGDGATFDIGLQCLSGMIERGHDVLFVYYDNEGYINPDIQNTNSASPETPTTTFPARQFRDGVHQLKKDVLSILAAHHIPYAATATIAYFPDLKAKVEKALTINGPRFLQILSPCPLSWGYEANLSIDISRLAVETGFFPLVEMEYGALTGVMRLVAQRPVEDYLRAQGRFEHLFATGNGQVEVHHLQALVDSQVRRYGLINTDTQWTTETARQVQRFGRGGYAEAPQEV